MARLLIALCFLLQGRHSNGQNATVPVATVPAVPVATVPAAGVLTSIPATTAVIFPDVSDTACTPGSYCTSNVGILTPQIRGLCVNSGTTSGQQCWDACNTNHSLDSFGMAQPAGTQKALAMMVKQLRTGNRYGSCPGSKSSAAETVCNPGERCTPPGLTWGRGMCITISNGTIQGDQCLDMCDTSIPMSTYSTTPGKEEGTLRIVRQVQAGRDPSGMTTCPGVTVWVWLWFPLLLCCCIGLCAGAYYGFSAYKSRLKPRNYREPINEPYMEEGQGPYVDYQDQQPQMDQYGDQAPPQTMDGMEDPMPVIEPQAEPLLAAPMAFEEKGPEINLFDQPNLMAGLAPLTVAAPTSAYPVAGSNYITSYTQAPITTYPQAGSMMIQGQPQAASMSVAAPVYLNAGAMTTQPTYGAYGAYGTSYPATSSMRIG